MEVIDYVIFAAYLIAMVGVGLYFYVKNQSVDDYFVGGRNIGSVHVGMSVVATDVGGGFSIGLGGLGFAMGLSGSWMLFTGLVGAWLSAVWLIPRVFKLTAIKTLYSMPQLFKHYYGFTAAGIAAVISFVGYVGFTSSQIVAGAKLASATFEGVSFEMLLLIMGVFTVVYTALGGLKAVIYTDTIQWLILMCGLLVVGIPAAYFMLGGWDAITAVLPSEMLRLDQISPMKMLNWSLTIIPIWFIGMTLYQRIFASRNEFEAKRAWFIAGLLEWPLMAFMGVILGLFARAAFEMQLISFPNGLIDPELGLPLLLRTALPVGVTGVILAAYFSAIMSTADSCLMAASGNFISDFLGMAIRMSPKQQLRMSQWSTLLLGGIAIYIGLHMRNVLELMLLSYAFMVSGLFVPIVMALSGKSRSAPAAIASMLGGGITAMALIYFEIEVWGGLDANGIGLSVSALLFAIFHSLFKK